MKNEVKEYIDVLATYSSESDFDNEKMLLWEEFNESNQYFQDAYGWDLTDTERAEAQDYIDNFEFIEPEEQDKPIWYYEGV